MRLLIAIPTMDTVPVEFMRSLLDLTRKLDAEGVDYTVEIEAGTLIYNARDRLASKAVNEGFDWILWLDSDMVFTDSVLDDLQFSGKDFVTGVAHGRRKPFPSCLFKSLDLSDLQRFTLGEYPADTFRVAGCGMACVLMKVEILKAVFMKFNTCFIPLLSYGEDLSFCKRAASLGWEIWAEPTVRLGHVSHFAVYPDDCERYVDEIH